MKNLSLLIFLLFGQIAYTQNATTCANALYEANRLYETGKITAAIALLQPCAKDGGFNTTESTEAYRLLVLCYLNNGNEPEAEVYMIKMLKSKPNYKDFPNIDPVNFRQMLNKFEVRNKMELGLIAGASVNQIRVIKNYSTTYSASIYIPVLGYQMGGLLEYRFKKKTSLVIEPQFYTFNYKREMENVGGWKQAYKENMLCIGIPVSYRYYYSIKTFKLLLECGLQETILINSYGNILSTNLSDKSSIQSSTKTTPYRSSAWLSGKAQIGFSKKVGAGYFSFRAAYNYTFSNIMISTKRYDNIPFLLSTQYIDPDFSPVYSAFTFGYQFPIQYSVNKSK